MNTMTLERLHWNTLREGDSPDRFNVPPPLFSDPPHRAFWMNKTEFFWTTSCLALFGFASCLSGCTRQTNEFIPPPPPTVTIAQPVRSQITPFLEQTGRTEAAEEAEVRSRVRGFIQLVDFEPGQPIEKDGLLYKIEPDLYQAEYDSALATVDASNADIKVKQAKVVTLGAEAKRAEQDLEREEELKRSNASSKAQYQTAVAANEAAIANVKAANADVDAATAKLGSAIADQAKAKLNLDYTEVRAPISGSITKTLVKLGNLVENGNPLATVVNDDVIFANFSISDRELLEFMKARALAQQESNVKPAKEDQWRGKKVYLKRETDDGFPFEGKLDYVDQSGIESDTGTLGLRASFNNKDRRLFPGLFVTVRVPAEASVESLLIPEAALQRNDQGSFVLTLDQDKIVKQKKVIVGQTVSGWAIIQQGLSVDDWVVIDGLQRARPEKEAVAKRETLSVDAEALLRGRGQPGTTPPTSQPTAPVTPATPPAAPTSSTQP
ncbi:MAG: efflux RND transporter periplasmic adaptor subunit [Rubripirellula sp.]|nr:efflux RND transporter periplasmic adaptor subunit [Rubripirellula sp.]